MTAGDVVEKSAEGGRGRRRQKYPAAPFRRRQAPGDEPDRRRLDIALDARDLPGKAQPWVRFEQQARIEKLRAVEESVAVKPTEPREFGVVEAGDGAEHTHLLAMFELSLEADHVPQSAERVVLTELHHGIGLHARAMRVRKTDRLHRAKAQRVRAALRHHLDREAALEIGRRFEVLE